MNKIEALVHLCRTGIITRERAMEIADNKGLSESDKAKIIEGIEKEDPVENYDVEPDTEETGEEPNES